MIADAGGGTIDVSTFEVTKTSPIELVECAPPDGERHLQFHQGGS